MDQREEVFVVDDDPSVRDALALALTAERYSVRLFSDGLSFLEAAKYSEPSAVLLDVHMPGRSGLEIMKQLNAEGYSAPVLIITGHGDIPMAVEAIKQGAHDFIEKPFALDYLISHLRAAVAAKRQQRNAPALHLNAPGIDETLTQREREVLREIASGASSKEAGRVLGISPRTIEVHRARIMEKLGARNTADLMRIVFSSLQ
jgi:FixJ family two-component response regulator